MSKAEKIVRLIVGIIASLLIVACYITILNYIKIGNPALEAFLHLAFSGSVGFIAGNSINNTLSLPDKEDED